VVITVDTIAPQQTILGPFVNGSAASFVRSGQTLS